MKLRELEMITYNKYQTRRNKNYDMTYACDCDLSSKYEKIDELCELWEVDQAQWSDDVQTKGVKGVVGKTAWNLKVD